MTRASLPSIIALARAGDRDAFDELVRRHRAHIRRLLQRLCKDGSLADDLAQDTFLHAWRRLHGLRVDIAFSSWLRQIAVSLWLQHLRRQPARPATESAETHAYDALDAAIDLDDALSRLTPHERLCVALAYGEGMSHSEIATATSLPLGTVKTLIARGSAYLRECLAAHSPAKRDCK
jgi:RNA polymerase sigma-70 factor (ECF subfamily)